MGNSYLRSQIIAWRVVGIPVLFVIFMGSLIYFVISFALVGRDGWLPVLLSGGATLGSVLIFFAVNSSVNALAPMLKRQEDEFYARFEAQQPQGPGPGS